MGRRCCLTACVLVHGGPVCCCLFQRVTDCVLTWWSDMLQLTLALLSVSVGSIVC